jgi:hypothetical protein
MSAASDKAANFEAYKKFVRKVTGTEEEYFCDSWAVACNAACRPMRGSGQCGGQCKCSDGTVVDTDEFGMPRKFAPGGFLGFRG